MTKTFKIVLILGVVILAIYLANYLLKLYREKQIFGGRTKQQFAKIMNDDWKSKYFEGMRNWIRKDNPDLSASQWANNLEVLAIQNDISFSKQKEQTIKYLWENNKDNQLYVPGKQSWHNTWSKEQAQSLGADINNGKVIEVLTSIHKQ